MCGSAERIRSRMESIRGQLDQDVDDVVESAKSMIDWRVYVSEYPWACLGAAVAIGYLVVPRQLEVNRPDADTLLELAKGNKLVVSANPSPQPSRGVAGMLFHVAAKAAVRGALSYLGQQLGKRSAQHGARPSNAQT